MNSYPPKSKSRPLRVAIISSTGGSVYRETCLRSPWLRDRIHLFLSDRQCRAVEAAHLLGHTAILHTGSVTEFSTWTRSKLDIFQIDLAISFYTKILKEPLLSAYKEKIINFHPSILPACPGLHGFEDTIASGARLLGSTVHYVDKGIDTGLPILQSHFYRETNKSLAEIRHKIFIQQCKALLQIVHWQEAGRIRIKNGFVQVADANVGDGEFSPALDAEDACAFSLS